MNKLIYITSNGRSGSTILELLLNTLDDTWTLGEVNVVPWELEEERQACGCGKKASECDFWQEVSEGAGDLLDTDGELNKFRESHGAGKILRWGQMGRMLIGTGPDTGKLKGFCSENNKFFNVVSDVLGEKDQSPKYFIDSSKDVYRLFWLMYCTGLDIKVVHLVKDPRAFVYSMTGHKAMPSPFKTARMSLRYVVENTLIDVVKKYLLDDQVYFLRYEDMAKDPDETMADLVGWLGLDYESDQYKKFREVENHGLAGNKSRMEGRDIYLDEKWKKDLDPMYKALIKAITYPLGKKYGYF